MRVRVEVHKGIAEVIRLEPGVEVEIVDLDAKAVVRYSRNGHGIDWHVLTAEELKDLE